MITISKSHQDAIKQVCQAASSKSHIQALENVHINASVDGIVTLKAGDSLVEVTRLVVADSVETGFTTTVNASKFMQSFNACNGDVTIIVKDEMTIKSGRRKFILDTINPDSYPSYPELTDDQIIDCPNLIELIKSVSWAAAVDDVRFYLNGAHIGECVVSTNGHKMSLVKANIDTDIIIPVEAVRKLPNLTSYQVSASDNILAIKTDDMEFKTKLVDGRFPDYKRVIRDVEKRATVNTEEFKNAIKAAAVLADEKKKTIVFTFGVESKVESAETSRKESSSIGFDCDTSDDIKFACSSAYILELINSVQSESVILGFNDNQLIVEDGDQTSIIMGVKV